MSAAIIPFPGQPQERCPMKAAALLAAKARAASEARIEMLVNAIEAALLENPERYPALSRWAQQ